MKTIQLNGKNHDLYVDSQRSLEILARAGYAAKLSYFEKGRGQRTRSMLNSRERRSAGYWTGIRTIGKWQARTAREKKFFRENPRCQFGVFGDVRRVNAILRAIT